MSTCYLCGNDIAKSDESRDHVPARLVFPESLRQKYNFDDLITLPTHRACNTSYSRDEEYFRVSLGVHAEQTPVGRFLWKDIEKDFRKGNKTGLGITVRDEFSDQTPGGIYLPPGKTVKHFDGTRVYRVVWKVVRGLFYHRYNRFLSETTPYDCRVYDPQQIQLPEIQEFWRTMMNRDGLGKYQGAFDYKLAQAVDVSDGLHACCLLFWDSVAFYYIFHDPNCSCKECSKAA